MAHLRPLLAHPVAVLACLSALAGAGTAQAQRTPVTPAVPVAETPELAPLCPGPAVLVTRTGELLRTARGFEAEGSRVRYLNESGTLVAVRLTELDAAATEEAEHRRCDAAPPAAERAPGEPGDGAAAAPEPGARPPRRDPVGAAIDALVELGVSRVRLEALAGDPPAFRAAIDAVVSVATELERRTREIERSYRLETVGGMLAAAPAYRDLAAFARDAAARERDPRIGAVVGDLAAAFDEVARLAAEEPERAIQEFQRQGKAP